MKHTHKYLIFAISIFLVSLLTLGCQEKEEKKVEVTPLEKNEEKKKEENAKTKTTVAKTGKRKVSKTWEAMQRLKGSLIVNDPKFLL